MTASSDESESRPDSSADAAADSDGSGAESDESPASADPVVVASDVTVSFGDVTVFSGVSVGADPGTVTALVGPNGSGKTTLLRVVAGLLPPDAGTVSLRSTSDRPVGYLPQTPAFRPGFTVRETLDFYASLVGGETDVEARLAQVGLSGVPDRRVEALSGGMTRLLGVAQALVGDPSVLVLDEPTSGLDPQMSRRVFDAVEGVRAEGVAVLLATHNLPAVERVADAAVLIDRGAVVARGPPADVVAESGSDTLADAFVTLVDREAARPAVRSGGDAP